MRSNDTDSLAGLDAQIADEVFGEPYMPNVHRFTSDDLMAERLEQWLADRGISPIPSQPAVTLWQRERRLCSESGDSRHVALARAVLRLVREYAEVLQQPQR